MFNQIWPEKSLKTVQHDREIARNVVCTIIYPQISKKNSGRQDEPINLCEDALINILQVKTIPSDALFDKIKAEDKKIRFQIVGDAIVNVLPKRLTSDAQFRPT